MRTRDWQSMDLGCECGCPECGLKPPREVPVIGETEGAVFIVVGRTGEYEDHYSWMVSACRERDQAEALAKELNEVASSISRRGNLSIEQREQVEELLRASGDRQASVDYTGSYYKVSEVPLLAPSPFKV